MNMSKKNWVQSATTSIALVSLSAVLLAGCGASVTTNGPSSNTAKIKVVAAENFYGEVAQAVGGDRVDVKSILTNPDQDPHDYEPTPDASKSVSDAQVVVYSGIGYDEWMDKLLKADSSSASKTALAVGSDLLGKQTGDNPHVWYDPATMPKLANKLAEDFAKLDPDHAKDYQQRAKDYIATLAPIDQKVAKIRQANPVLVDVSEPVFGYMADALNLKPNNPEFSKAMEDGNDPSASDLAKVQDDMKNKKVKMFVYNIQVDSPTVKNVATLAESSGIPVIQVTETEPTGKNYLQWMTDQIDQVGKALGIQ